MQNLLRLQFLGVDMSSTLAVQQSQNTGRSLLGFGGTAFISVFLFSCVVNLLMLTGPLFMLQVYDRVLTSGSVPTLLALSAIVLLCYLYYGFLEYVRSRMMVRVGRKFEENLRGRVFDAMAQLTLQRTANIGGQPVADLATVRQYVSSAGPLAFFDMPWVPIYLFIVFMLHFWLGVAGLVAAVVIFVLAVWTEAATRGPLGKAAAASTKAAIMTDEARRSAEAMHALGMRGILRKRWTAMQQEALDFQTLASDSGGKLSAASRTVRLVVQSGMLALGAYLAIQGEISPGAIIASSIIMGRGLAPIEQAVGNWQQFLSARKAMDRLVKIMGQVPPEPERMPLPKPKGLLEVENLIIMAQGQEKPLLNGLSFTVTPGQGLGVIGPTGAGKSTLARVLTGVVPPNRGTVRLDGASINQRSIDDYGRVVGYLPQDVQLFDGTVAQNIARFQEDAQPEAIVNAAQLANVHDLVMRLPQGYDTPLGENGARLSAGQRQRVALARALYGDPALIVMDEPNSNLDAEGEVALDRAIRAALQRGAAVVVVAHRPSALHAVSHILVLNDGKAVANGPRDEVLKQVTKQPQQQQPQARPAAALPPPNPSNPITRN
jgi:PrtD family type I secretion system ABC transporter